MLINSTNTNAAPALTLPLPNLQCGADGTARPDSFRCNSGERTVSELQIPLH